MALNKYYNNISDDNSTQTIVSDYTGMIFKVLIYNGNTKVKQNTIKLYIEDGGVLYKKDLDQDETFEVEPKILLQNEKLKIYASNSDVDVITEMLVN